MVSHRFGHCQAAKRYACHGFSARGFVGLVGVIENLNETAATATLEISYRSSTQILRRKCVELL